MAWMRAIEQRCQRCGRKATHEVLNVRNASHGYFCRQCAKRELERLNREEQKP